jgi:hypothetical protein
LECSAFALGCDTRWRALIESLDLLPPDRREDPHRDADRVAA